MKSRVAEDGCTAPEPTDIAIIGGGASGALLAWGLATRHGLACTVIDPAERPGLGLAYATRFAGHLLNVRSDGMSADPDAPTHFLDWLRANHDALARPESFAPRLLYGRYLQSLLAEAAPTHVRGRVARCAPVAGGFALTLEDGRALHARRVVLATGNFDPARLPGIDPAVEAAGRYHHTAWSAAGSGALPNDAGIVLIGTGLTTVDAILSLRAAGHRGHITALSRHGLLPARHAPTIPADGPAVPEETPATARACFDAFRAALGRGVPWRAAIDSMRFRTNAIWAVASEAEKARFRRHLQRRWEVARHRMAPPVADIMDTLLAEDALTLRHGHVTRVRLEGDVAVVSAEGPEGALELRAAHVINCTGPDLRYDRVASPLLNTLLADGLARPGRAGAGLRSTPDGQVIGRDGEVVDGLFALGPPRLGDLFESIAIPDIRRQARALADLLGEARPEPA